MVEKLLEKNESSDNGQSGLVAKSIIKLDNEGGYISFFSAGVTGRDEKESLDKARQLIESMIRASQKLDPEYRCSFRNFEIIEPGQTPSEKPNVMTYPDPNNPGHLIKLGFSSPVGVESVK